MMQTARQTNHRAAFTITELLAAIAVTVILILLIGRIFTDASNAVSVGAGISDVISAGRNIENQIRRDATEMLGPGGLTPGADSETYRFDASKGGFLVIVNRKITGATVTAPGAGETTRDVYSDQLYFIRANRNAEVANAPTNNGSFTNNTYGEYIRVAYLHGRRTAEDGTDSDMSPSTADTVTGNTNHYLGRVGGRNELATNWILCRQALHLNEKISSGLPSIHVRGGWYNADRVGDDQPDNALKYLFMGTVDTASYSLHNPLSETVTGESLDGLPFSDPPQGMMFGKATDTTLPNHGKTLFADLSESNYESRAMEFTFGKKRLRVNLAPPSYSSSNTDPFQSWEMGQMHSFLSARISDFKVEFAADLNGDGDIDTESGGEIKWYHGIDNAPSFSSSRGSSSIGASSGYDPTATASGLPHADHIYVFRHDDFGSDCQWPAMLRIRYRVHDGNGRVAEPNASGDPETGRWFEVIVKVTRP